MTAPAEESPVHLPVADAVERMPSLAGAGLEERADRIVHLVLQHHWMPASLQSLSLRDAWRVVRDAVEAVERGSAQWPVPFPSSSAARERFGVLVVEDDESVSPKLRLVEAVVWRVIDTLGGVGELRALLLARLPGGGIGRALVSWLVSERVIRALVRYTIELAVRESWSRERRVQVTGLQRGVNQQPHKGVRE